MSPKGRRSALVTLAMMVAGIVMGKKAQLSAMSGQIPSGTKDASIEKRMHRWVKNDNVSEAMYFVPFVKELLASLSDKTLVFGMDGSCVGRGCVALMVGVLYQNRMIPIAWIVYKGKKGHASSEIHIELLKKLHSLVPDSLAYTL